jgi:hypothetical protein
VRLALRAIRRCGARVNTQCGMHVHIDAAPFDGRTNMLDWPAVARIAEAMGLDSTAAWVRTHQREYSAGIFRGFAAEKKGGESCADK